jgi:hypothetical protein
LELTMAKSFDELTKRWSAARLVRVKARAKKLIAKEMTLRGVPVKRPLRVRAGTRHRPSRARLEP